MTKMYKCPVAGCKSFTIDEPNLPCARHGMDMVVDYDRTKIENADNSEEVNDISLCPSCNCMTHTIDGHCGKCKEDKPVISDIAAISWCIYWH